jgi:hypothetical protein
MKVEQEFLLPNGGKVKMTMQTDAMGHTFCAAVSQQQAMKALGLAVKHVQQVAEADTRTYRD